MILLASERAEAAKRIALVIGNAAYMHAPELANPRNDAQDMAAKLEKMGFEVVLGADLTMGQTRAAVRNFITKLDNTDMALFYYAGHGVQVNGENYLAPVDAKLTSYDFLEFETLSVETVVRAMERNVKTNLVVLDACRDNPLAQNLARSMGTRSGSVGRGLAKVGSGIGTLIAFSTQPGNVAIDGKGRNSPYTAALLKHLGTPGADITRDLVRVRNQVLATTNGKQVPWENSSLTGEVVLVPKAEPSILDTTVQNPLAAQTSNAAEIAFWNSVKTAQSVTYYKAYLNKWPDGTFSSIAQIRIRELEQKAEYAAKSKAAEAARLRADELAAVKQKATDIEARLMTSEAERLALAKAVEQAHTRTQLAPAAEVVPSDGKPRDDRQLVRNIQEQLNRIGCSVGRPDGMWGKRSARGLRNYAKFDKARLASLDPSKALLARLRNESRRICPLICHRGYQETGGRCVAIQQQRSIDKSERAKRRKPKPRATRQIKANPKTGDKTCGGISQYDDPQIDYLKALRQGNGCN